MTKLRDPLTFEDAIVRIAAVIGWPAMAEACGASERTVRNWSDPDTPERLPASCAVLLDTAYQAGGGDGAPCYETFGHQLKANNAERFADEAMLGQHAIDVIREGGEAHAALVAASRPGATEKERTAALREVQENMVALNRTLPLLTKSMGPVGDSGEGSPRGGATS